ncbi:MAG: hypothetical protein LBV12_11690, partial [Puniceicoccales bacterium]|nr:hypothetical protein [Puniceicoccales bacterium]
MNPHLEKARLLYRQERFSLAEQELMQALAVEPQNADCFSLLALCRGKQKDIRGALARIKTAIGFEPDAAYYHYLQSIIRSWGRNIPGAIESITEAIRLDPYNADYYSLM